LYGRQADAETDSENKVEDSRTASRADFSRTADRMTVNRK
jgi:hypothetical protein